MSPEAIARRIANTAVRRAARSIEVNTCDVAACGRQFVTPVTLDERDPLYHVLATHGWYRHASHSRFTARAV
jgi:hypothetical protein